MTIDAHKMWNRGFCLLKVTHFLPVIYMQLYWFGVSETEFPKNHDQYWMDKQ